MSILEAPNSPNLSADLEALKNVVFQILLGESCVVTNMVTWMNVSVQSSSAEYCHLLSCLED